MEIELAPRSVLLDEGGFDLRLHGICYVGYAFAVTYFADNICASNAIAVVCCHS